MYKTCKTSRSHINLWPNCILIIFVHILFGIRQNLVRWFRLENRFVQFWAGKMFSFTQVKHVLCVARLQYTYFSWNARNDECIVVSLVFQIVYFYTKFGAFYERMRIRNSAREREWVWERERECSEMFTKYFKFEYTIRGYNMQWIS